MDLERLAKNGAWCPDPWGELSSDTGTHYKLCCYSNPLKYNITSVSPLEHWNSADMREVRKAMLNGDRAQLRQYCEACYVQEDAGAESRRHRRLREIVHDTEFRERIGDAVSRTAEAGDGSAPVEYFHRVDLRVAGNLCNLRCVMCSPQSSSAIGEEMKQLARLPANARTLTLPIRDLAAEKRERFWRDLEEVLPRTHYLYFAGGEPFLSEAHYEVLDLALRLGLEERVHLWYSTNLTKIETSAGRTVIQYLKKFKHVYLSVSVDNLYAKNDYIRHGSRFLELVANIRAVKELCPHVRVEPSTCVSILNILDLYDIHFFLKEVAGCHVFSNILTRPKALRANYLPPGLRTLALQRLSREARLFQTPMRWLEAPVELSEQAVGFTSFVNFCRRIDEDRGTNFLEVFPDFVPYVAAARI